MVRIVRAIKEKVARVRKPRAQKRPALETFTTENLRGFLASMKPGTAKTVWTTDEARIVSRFLDEVDRAYGAA